VEDEKKNSANDRGSIADDTGYTKEDSADDTGNVQTDSANDTGSIADDTGHSSRADDTDYAKDGADDTASTYDNGTKDGDVDTRHKEGRPEIVVQTTCQQE
jgi:hypothetical protein